MKFAFSKMHGLGNDFVVFDALRQPLTLSPKHVRWLADRHCGIGCDQVLVVEQTQHKDADFRYRIFNADGGEVEQCGNGARCFVVFVHNQGLTTQRSIRVETQCGIITPRLEDNGEVSVNMGIPRFAPAEIPFTAPQEALHYSLPVAGQTVRIAALSMGNPHAVLQVTDCAQAPVAELGPQIECHPAFPQRVNVGFMEFVDLHTIRLRVYERGAGETLACGTGACAAAVAGIRSGQIASPVRVCMRGGDLTIAWTGNGTPVMMTGPATHVFSGEIELTLEQS